jgi:hypothetical protein
MKLYHGREMVDTSLLFKLKFAVCVHCQELITKCFDVNFNTKNSPLI